MTQIIHTLDGQRLCEDCHADICDPVRRESEHGLFVHHRADTGRCQCCEAEVVAGELLDSPVGSL